MSSVKAPYAVYMMMHHHTVNGTMLLAQVRVGQADSFEDAKVVRSAVSLSTTSEPKVNSIRQAVLAMNPQAGAVQTTFQIAFEG